ncbi:MAG: hypothetical protein RIT02_639 [Planctomycetota bacterium]
MHFHHQHSRRLWLGSFATLAGSTLLPPLFASPLLPTQYKDNGDGTVTDTVSGLTWQQTDAGEMTLEQARQYAEQLQLGGHDDWRLPLPMELFCIMDHRLHGPAMNTRWFPASAARYWWTETARPDSRDKYWQVNTGGGIGAHAKSEASGAGGENPVHTRCVRGTSPWGAGPRLQKNTDSTVTDQITGLVWQQQLNSQAMTWEQAQQYCSELVLGGHSDWRLPTIRELRSISDDRLAQPSLNPDIFSGADSIPCWSATTQMNRPERAWYTDFTSGLVTYRDKTEHMRVLAVRGSSPLTADPTDAVTPNPRGGGGGSKGRGGKGKDKARNSADKAKPPRKNPAE